MTVTKWGDLMIVDPENSPVAKRRKALGLTKTDCAERFAAIAGTRLSLARWRFLEQTDLGKCRLETVRVVAKLLQTTVDAISPEEWMRAHPKKPH